VNTQKRIITAKEVAGILGVSQMMVKDMVERKIIPGDVVRREGKRDRIIIPRAKFEEYLGEKTSA
jgi:predicted transcriptional regulator